MSKNFGKTIKTILIFLFLMVLIGGGIFLILNANLFKPKTDELKTVVPKEIHISNVQDKQFTISWITKEKTAGFVKYGISNSLEQTALDDRDQRTGEIGEYKTHYITIKNLEPEKTYYFKIGSGSDPEDDNIFYDNNGQPYSLITGSLFTTIQESKILSGKILNSDKTPAQETIIYLSAANMAPLSVLTDKNGRWAIFLNKARTKDLSEYAVFDLEATVLQVKAQDGNKETSAVILTKDAFPAVPDLTLGNELYDFREGKLPQQLVVTDPSTITTVTIINPSEDGEKINTLKPEFQGQGPPDTILTIEINSPTYTGTATVKKDGSWVFSPPADLTPGNHTISISYTNESGETETVNRSFTILSAGESELPAITATPSGEVASPTPSPVITPSPSASSSSPPRTTMPSTDEGVPTTGLSWPTILMAILGMSMVYFGIKSKKVFS